MYALVHPLIVTVLLIINCSTYFGGIRSGTLVESFKS